MPVTSVTIPSNIASDLQNGQAQMRSKLITCFATKEDKERIIAVSSLAHDVFGAILGNIRNTRELADMVDGKVVRRSTTVHFDKETFDVEIVAKGLLLLCELAERTEFYPCQEELLQQGFKTNDITN